MLHRTFCVPLATNPLESTAQAPAAHWMDSANDVPADWFSEWIDAHYVRIQRAAFILTGNRADAEDLTQETLLRALRGSARFAGRSTPETWLYAILLNTHRQRCRSDLRLWRRWCDWWNGVGSRASSPRPEDDLATREWSASIWAAVAELPLALRQTVLLRFAEQLSYEEIAGVLDCPIGTVRSRLHAATERLRNVITPEMAGSPLTPDTTPCLAR